MAKLNTKDKIIALLKKRGPMSINRIQSIFGGSAGSVSGAISEARKQDPGKILRVDSWELNAVKHLVRVYAHDGGDDAPKPPVSEASVARRGRPKGEQTHAALLQKMRRTSRGGDYNPWQGLGAR